MPLAANPFGYHRPGNRVYHRESETFAGATRSGTNNEGFTHSSIPVSFYPLNNAKKLNYFNPPSIFLEPPYNYLFSQFLGILGLKTIPQTAILRVEK